ncbi:MAG TPA: V-type ATPase subunit subunit G family protein [Methanolinea sp.]|jgi:vacuolar-type H+-ATPase subunit H|nr:V-type ATPase subunit subunit G family protein [Methanolinea sp.]MDI6900036.1 V-type ATPase subunit subunit G family protein [Methanolinea sp.]HOS81535.1 V-type ATPase subunit subunit G family protein [Methanolinea sp.]HPC54879.1 V-type ATPase subunit subunit G family protein [Methanolinea sp.]HQE85386.1 V-type ATPase subunit subunit G family protein [Methanolinea sp.]
MDQESSLLEVVRKKELELKSRIEKATKEAEETIAQARRRAEEILESARKRGEEESSRFMGEQEKAMDQEIREIRESSLLERKQVSARAGEQIDKAVELIIGRIVAKGP